MATTTLSEVKVADKRLVGDDLISFVKKNGAMTKSELAKATGYTSTDKDGSIRCNITAMTSALVEAAGFSFGKGDAKVGIGGRKLSYTAKVQGNGNLLVGKAYTAMLGLETGAEFEIKLSKQTGTIRLVPVGEADEDE